MTRWHALTPAQCARLRICWWCSKEIPHRSRSDMAYCSDACKMKAYRLRKDAEKSSQRSAEQKSVTTTGQIRPVNVTSDTNP